jgi:hypothetical protein
VVYDHPRLVDKRGRNIPTVIARPVDAAGTARLERAAESDADTVLRAIDREPGKNLSDIARSLGWLLRSKEPHHMRVKRAVDILRKDKLVEESRNKWRTTPKGQKEINEAENRAAAKQPPPRGGSVSSVAFFVG